MNQVITVEGPKYEYCRHVMRLCQNARVCSQRERDDFNKKTEPLILRSGNSCQAWRLQQGSGDSFRDTPIICKSCGKIRLLGGCDPYCTDCHFKYRCAPPAFDAEFVR